MHEKRETHVRIIYLLFLAILSPVAWADPVRDLSELALLPQYCRGTQQIRSISKDSRPIEQYVTIYGYAYIHLHHYCWALNTENNALRLKPGDRRAKLTYSLADYKYFLDRAPPNFILLPEIYTSRARVLFTLKRDVEAVMDLVKAIELKADYAPAYARLSDYYQGVGDKSNAIKILEQGISHTKNPTNVAFFIRKLEKLGITYQGTAGSALPKENESTHDKKPSDLTEEKESAGNDQASVPDKTPLPATPSTENVTPDLTGKDTPADQQAKPNPYCRFCP